VPDAIGGCTWSVCWYGRCSWGSAWCANVLDVFDVSDVLDVIDVIGVIDDSWLMTFSDVVDVIDGFTGTWSVGVIM